MRYLSSHPSFHEEEEEEEEYSDSENDELLIIQLEGEGGDGELTKLKLQREKDRRRIEREARQHQRAAERFSLSLFANNAHLNSYGFMVYHCIHHPEREIYRYEDDCSS